VNFIHKHRQTNPKFVKENQNDLAASIQHTILEMLMEHLIKASEETGIKRVALAGGVSANSELRQRIKNQETDRNWETFIPPFEFCTDNGAMIAIAGYYDFLENKEGKLSDAAVARWKM
jgi:N6-L-threonylcarbamoyladenine synthase